MAEELTLPEPARSLWLELRDGVQESLREVGVEEYAIGGGTVLSARWNHHRRSHDIDLTVGENTRIHLLEDEDGSGFAQRMTELGGKIEFWPARRLIQVKFGEPPNNSGLDIWGHELQLSGAEERARIDGREETVLSTAQVLWGKVARGDRALPRDVYDIVEAARRDPEALGIAEAGAASKLYGRRFPAYPRWLHSFGRAVGGAEVPVFYAFVPESVKVLHEEILGEETFVTVRLARD